MSHKVTTSVTADDVTKMLQEAKAPVSLIQKEQHQQLAGILNLMLAYPICVQTSQPNRRASELDSGIAALRKALPDYIRFWQAFEDSPLSTENSKARIENLREIQRLLGITFPRDLSIRMKEKSHWREVEPDIFESQAQTPWHEKALYLFGWYQNHVDEGCGISRDGAAARFVQAALKRSGVGHYSLDAIEKALSRARQAPPRRRASAKPLAD
jgi:hypothetical protein